MAKYVIDDTTLEAIANAIRFINGEQKTYTPLEMEEAVKTIMDSATYLLVDEYGTEIPAVWVDSKVVFTATPNDIRIGTTAAIGEGVVTGTKEIPAYYVTEGYRLIPSGSEFTIPFFNHRYDFTKIQAIICPWDGNLDDSVSANKVVIGENVYIVNSTDVIASVTKNNDTKTISLGIVNDSGSLCVLRYFTYREEK